MTQRNRIREFFQSNASFYTAEQISELTGIGRNSVLTLLSTLKNPEYTDNPLPIVQYEHKWGLRKNLEAYLNGE